MHTRKLFNQLLAFGSESNVSLAPIGLAGFARNQFPFGQAIDNVNGGVVFYLKALAQLRDGRALRRCESFDREERFVLLRIRTCGCAKEIFAEAEKFAEQVTKLGQCFIIVRVQMCHGESEVGRHRTQYRSSIHWHAGYCLSLYLYI